MYTEGLEEECNYSYWSWESVGQVLLRSFWTAGILTTLWSMIQVASVIFGFPEKGDALGNPNGRLFDLNEANQEALVDLFLQKNILFIGGEENSELKAKAQEVFKRTFSNALRSHLDIVSRLNTKNGIFVSSQLELSQKNASKRYRHTGAKDNPTLIFSPKCYQVNLDQLNFSTLEAKLQNDFRSECVNAFLIGREFSHIMHRTRLSRAMLQVFISLLLTPLIIMLPTYQIAWSVLNSVNLLSQVFRASLHRRQAALVDLESMEMNKDNQGAIEFFSEKVETDRKVSLDHPFPQERLQSAKKWLKEPLTHLELLEAL